MRAKNQEKSRIMCVCYALTLVNFYVNDLFIFTSFTNTFRPTLSAPSVRYLFAESVVKISAVYSFLKHKYTVKTKDKISEFIINLTTRYMLRHCLATLTIVDIINEISP